MPANHSRRANLYSKESINVNPSIERDVAKNLLVISRWRQTKDSSDKPPSIVQGYRGPS